MPAQFPSNGGQPQKPPKAATLYTGRFFYGLNTNRSPLRGLNTAFVEKFYSGSSNDALIGGLNTEISNRLTLCRRPGNPIYTNPTTGVASATFDDVDRFESFHLLGPTTEDIDVMIDTVGQVGAIINTGFSALLLSAASYAILAAAGITNTGTTVVTGGLIGSYPTPTITFDGGTATVDNIDAAQAQIDALAAYNALLTRTFTSLGTAVDLSTSGVGGSGTYYAGNYSSTSSMDIPTSITLDAQGNPNAQFVFYATASTIKLETNASVILINGAQADNVVWLVGSSFTQVAPGNMVGNILANTSITLGGGGTFTGRALAGIVTSSGAVTIASAYAITVVPTSGGTNPGTYASIWTGLDATGTTGVFPGGSMKALVFQKTVAQQAFMESVGNILFFGDSAEQRKWLETVTTWASIPTITMSQGQYPFFSTYIIDSNLALQQLIAAVLTNAGNVTITTAGTDPAVSTVVFTAAAGTVLSTGIFSSTSLNPLNAVDPIATGTPIEFQGFATATQLNGAFGYVTAIAGNTVTVVLTTPVAAHVAVADAGLAVIVNGGTPTKGATQPTWATTALVPAAVWPYPSNVLTVDGTALWINRSNPTSAQAAGIFNWGIKPPTGILNNVSPNVGSGAWEINTFYSLDGVVIAKTINGGDLWQVTTAGAGAGTTEPFTSGHAVGFQVVNGGVTWTLIQTAASLIWTAGAIYCPQHVDVNGNPVAGTGQYVVANAGGVPCLFQLQPVLVPRIVLQAASPSNTKMSAGDYVDLWYYVAGSIGKFQPVPATTGGATATASVNSLIFNPGPDPNEQPMVNATLNQAGEITGVTTPFASARTGYSMVALFSIEITQEFMNNNNGQCSIVFSHDDGAVLACSQAVTWAQTNPQNLNGQATGALNTSWTVIGGNNIDGDIEDTGTLTFPSAGIYDFEVDYYQNQFQQTLVVQFANYTPAPTVGPYTITSCASASAGKTVYVGTFPVGVITPVGQTFNVTGFTVNAANNGYFLCSAATTTHLTLVNPSGVAETAVAVATCKSVQAMGTNPVIATPAWPTWGTGAAPLYPAVTESSSYPGNGHGVYSPTGGYLVWNNHGPASDFVWKKNENFTQANDVIIDTNGNQEGPYEAGYTAATQPTWKTALNALTLDNPNLSWVNEGPVPSSTDTNLLTVGNGNPTDPGWRYGIALVNTLDNTVSNMSQFSVGTGPFTNAEYVQLPPGYGLPPIAQIDPQADYVAIFRTTDGGATPLLIPGIGNSIYTLPLNEYLKYGYQDTTPDTGLNAELQGAMAGENTPPALGAINLSYHLSRIWYSIGNVVYWTTGPAAPIGNGINGTSPLNFAQMPSLVKRLFPTSVGMLVFTISDVYIIPGQGTTANPIQPGQPYLPGIGLLSYNALDFCGTIIGLLTTDGTQMMIDPGGGFVDTGQPIGNNFGLQNVGILGQNWSSSSAYIAWYVNGEDQAWYIADGETGWYRCCTTPAPEAGSSWSPFAQIAGGTNATPAIKAVQAIEVQPGIKRLLIGPFGVGQILRRASLFSPAFTDGTASYLAYADIGSVVLVNPGQVAGVNFFTTESVRIGNPLRLGVLLDEATPYTSVPFDMLKQWETDPTNQPTSRSILAQRFYVSDDPDIDALCRHLQVRIYWGNDTVQNELIDYTISGVLYVEQ